MTEVFVEQPLASPGSANYSPLYFVQRQSSFTQLSESQTKIVLAFCYRIRPSPKGRPLQEWPYVCCCCCRGHSLCPSVRLSFVRSVAQRTIDDCWGLIDDWLMIDWWLINDWVMIDWWLIDNWLMIGERLIDNWLIID